MKVAKQKSEELARLAALVRQMKIGMLTTIEPDGSLRSRPLETVEIDREGRLWFFTQAHSPKSARAEAGDHQVNLSYADPRDEDFASISGTARVVRDAERMRELGPLVSTRTGRPGSRAPGGAHRQSRILGRAAQREREDRDAGAAAGLGRGVRPMGLPTPARYGASSACRAALGTSRHVK